MTALGRPWRVIDLFSGRGGMSYGFREWPEAFRVIAAVDMQAAKPGTGKSSGTTTQCNDTYGRNIGVRPEDADLSRMDARAFREELGLLPGELEVLISCAPCTGCSQKNARNHLEDDPRNGLVERTADFVG